MWLLVFQFLSFILQSTPGHVPTNFCLEGWQNSWLITTVFPRPRFDASLFGAFQSWRVSCHGAGLLKPEDPPAGGNSQHLMSCRGPVCRFLGGHRKTCEQCDHCLKISQTFCYIDSMCLRKKLWMQFGNGLWDQIHGRRLRECWSWNPTIFVNGLVPQFSHHPAYQWQPGHFCGNISICKLVGAQVVHQSDEMIKSGHRAQTMFFIHHGPLLPVMGFNRCPMNRSSQVSPNARRRAQCKGGGGKEKNIYNKKWWTVMLRKDGNRQPFQWCQKRGILPILGIGDHWRSWMSHTKFLLVWFTNVYNMRVDHRSHASGISSWSKKCMTQYWNFASYIATLPAERWVRRTLAWKPRPTYPPRGGPQQTWDTKLEMFCRYKALGNWEIVARNAARWDSLLPCFLDFCSM